MPHETGEGTETLLLVDDNATNLDVLYGILDGQGYRLLVARNGEQALKIAGRARPDLVLLDIQMPPGMDGYEVCRRMKEDPERDAAVIFLSALDDAAAKVRGLELGAVDFVTKPFQGEEVQARVRTHLTIRRLQRETVARAAELEHELAVARELVQEAGLRREGPLLGSSPAVARLRDEIERIASSDSSLLVTGAAGTGHEAVARAIHGASARALRPFLYVDALSLGEGADGTLFGEPITDDTTPFPGKWALAAGGTLCIDHVDALAPALQSELTRRLDAQPGDDHDVHLVALCVGSSGAGSSSGSGDSVLRERLQASQVELPRLDQRREDIPVLVEHLLRRKAASMGKPGERLTAESLERLTSYSWPGNLDELQSVLDCALVASSGAEVEVDPSLLEAGTRFGQYQLVEQIGAGGMGEVWLARHRLLVRPAAVKLIRAQGGQNPRLVTRFQREARATAQLESIHTVRLYDFGVSDDGAFYYVMEYLRGMDLGQIVQRTGPLPVERAVHFLVQACGSLAEAHAAGLVHRDIKPANLYACVLGTDADVLKVLDFGLVREQDRSDGVELTGEHFVGTPAFLAPEVALRSEGLDGRADLYSLGCTAFWMLTGRNVFAGESGLAVALHHANTAPPRLAEAAPGVPPALDELVAACLAKAPADRPADAAELRRLLLEIPLDSPWTPERAQGWWHEHGTQDGESGPTFDDVTLTVTPDSIHPD